MKISIRPYKESDSKAILEDINFNILNSTALYDYNIRTLEQQTEILKEKIDKNFPVIVAVLNEKIVGFGYYSEYRFREAYKYTVEHSVYVNKDFQGMKIGHLIMECDQNQNCRHSR